MAVTVVSFPIPEGVTASFSPTSAGDTTQFFLDAGLAVVTFNPLDVNNPGTLTLKDQNSNVILTMNSGGYARFVVPVGGLKYLFNLTAPANTVAATLPNSSLFR